MGGDSAQVTNEDVRALLEQARRQQLAYYSFRSEPQAWIRTLLASVSRDTLAADLNHLVSFPTRASTTAHYTEVAGWARAQLATGYLTRTEQF